MTAILRILCLLLLLFHFAVPTDARNGRQYRLLWKDNFKGSQINGKNWDKLYRTSPGSWGMYMSKSDSVYELKKGKLRLYGKANNGIEPSDTAHYLCGGITTRHKRSITYGKIEIRLKMKGARGTWPAVWLMPVDYKHWQYPQRAEIDILEYLHQNDFVYQTVHTYYTDSLRQTNIPPRQAKPRIKYEKYNVYALEILPSELIFSINGKETFRYPKLNDAPEGQYPFGVESYLMIDMQIGGEWVGNLIDTTQFPVYIDIDWVKFYELKEL